MRMIFCTLAWHSGIVQQIMGEGKHQLPIAGDNDDDSVYIQLEFIANSPELLLIHKYNLKPGHIRILRTTFPPSK